MAKDTYSKEKRKAYNQRYRGILMYMVAKLKESSGCMDCKVKHRYYTLHFDHRDPSTKLFNIATAAGGNDTGKQKILEEIDKCDVICANCHSHRSWGATARDL